MASLLSHTHWLRELGHLRVSDGEPALVAFRGDVREKIATDPERPTKHMPRLTVGMPSVQWRCRARGANAEGTGEGLLGRTRGSYHSRRARILTVMWCYNRFYVRRHTKLRLRTYAPAHRAVWREGSRHAPGRPSEEWQLWHVFGARVGRGARSDEHNINSKAGVFHNRPVRAPDQCEDAADEFVFGREVTPSQTQTPKKRQKKENMTKTKESDPGREEGERGGGQTQTPN